MSACRCGCGKPAERLNVELARSCYERWRQHGRPSVPPPPSRPGNDRCKPFRVEDYLELHSWGESVKGAAARLGVSERTVWRYRADLLQLQEASEA